MKASTSWIKDLLSRTIISDEWVVNALDRAGMEVEQIIASEDIDKHVVVGLVKKVVQHPNADKLRLAEVAAGGSVFHVVCGASNLEEAQKVGFAQVGTVLPDGEQINKAKLRGEVSEGMICSERELRLGDDHEGILVLPEESEEGTALCDMYPADTVVDLKTPPNRFDVLGMVGLARDVAAMAGTHIKQLPAPMGATKAGGPEVAKDSEAARYMLARISVDQSRPTPAAVAARLRAVGMRSLGAVVDATNYVMLETGQPVHAFDAAKVRLPIGVRYARKGETMETLDGVKRELEPEDLVIVDQSGPVAIAGVMGGAATEVGPDTKEILLEVAVFDGVSVRKTAKRHNLRTEASMRFERGLPVELPPVALARAAELFGELADGKVLGVADQLSAAPREAAVEFTASWLTRLLGFEITAKEAAKTLGRLDIDAQVAGDIVTVAKLPWWRPDLALREDLAEEIVRVLGYERVPSTIPSWQPKRIVFDRRRAKLRRVRDLMYGAGLFEVMTYSFVAEEQLMGSGMAPDRHLKLKNPLSTEQAYLRSSLLPSHLSVLAKNRTYAKAMAFYEISNVFVPKGGDEQPDEALRLGAMVLRPEDAFAYAKGLLDRLARELNLDLAVEPGKVPGFASGRSGVVKLGRRPVGLIGQLAPNALRERKLDGEAAYFEVELEYLLRDASVTAFSALSRLPSIKRDISVLVPAEVTWREVSRSLRDYAGEFVGDYYGGELPEGKKSLTVRITVSHKDRTPTEAEAAAAEDAVVARLSAKFKAEKRA